MHYCSFLSTRNIKYAIALTNEFNSITCSFFAISSRLNAWIEKCYQYELRPTIFCDDTIYLYFIPYLILSEVIQPRALDTGHCMVNHGVVACASGHRPSSLTDAPDGRQMARVIQFSLRLPVTPATSDFTCV